MKLKLVKQGDFLGTKCDFYVDGDNNIYMSRTQIGYALGYKDPSNAILRIHQRHYERLDKMSLEVKGCQFVTPYPNKNKNAHIYMYVVQGAFEICRHSNQPHADKFYDWVYQTVIEIARNGYYITTAKDEKWLGIRQETKQTRRMETDTIKRFVSYAERQGSTHAGRYYQLFTDLVQKHLGIAPESRDKQDQKTLLRLKSLETVVDMHLDTLMGLNMPYKDIFIGVRNLIKSI